MTCERFREAVVASDEPWAAVPPDSAAASHLAVCAVCGPWFARYSAGAAHWAADHAADLAVAVLARTSHAACVQAQEQLASRLDAPLDRDDDALVMAHLSHCGECRDVDAALAALIPLLPALAERQPDAAFVADVLARTSRRPARAPWLDGVRATWDRLVQRPRFAWEAAYVCTLCWLLVFGQPMAAFEWSAARVRPDAVMDIRKLVPAQPVSVPSWSPTAGISRAAGRLEASRQSAADTALGAWRQARLWVQSLTAQAVTDVLSAWDAIVAWAAAFVTPPATPASVPSAPTTEPSSAAVRSSK